MSFIYDNSDSHRFRPRYNFEDTAHLLPQDTPIPLYIRCYRCLACCFSSRRRLGILLALLFFFYEIVANFSVLQEQSPRLARVQSYGYITREPKHKWVDRAKHYRQVPHNYLPPPANDDSLPLWYDSHVLVDFACPKLQRVIGSASDPAKWWICNIHHLASKPNCIIYTTGPPNGLLLEKRLQPLVPSCQIHYMDPTKLSTPTAPVNSTIHVQPFGLSGTTRQIVVPAASEDGTNATSHLVDFQTLTDTMKTLGHTHVDLLILFCSTGCEWSMVQELIHVQQLVVQVHGMHNVDFFTTLSQAGFVLFHKEPTEWKGFMGQAQILSFLKLKPKFFELGL